MSHCVAAILPDRGVVRVGGADASKFLQGLITSNMESARDGTAIHAALLSPQGKILFDFFVVPAADGFLLDSPRSAAGELAKRLGFYRLRAEVTITEESGFAVAAAWGEAPPAQGGVIAYPDPRLPDLGTRMLLPVGAGIEALSCSAGSDADYHALRIGLGVPEGGRDFIYGDTFPHEALLDQLHGVDFAKGCFVGQEVVSRMEHRGTARKRIVKVEGNAALPLPGTEVEAGGATIGRLGSVSGTSGLALLRLDRATEALASGKSLVAGGVSLRLVRPAFVRFDVPTAASG